MRSEENKPDNAEALDRIAEQKDCLERLKGLCERIDKCDKETEGLSANSFWQEFIATYSPAGDLELIKRSLACHMSAITLDVKRQEDAIENGSESGDLRSHDEKHILQGCLALLDRVGGYFQEYLNFVGFEPETDEEKFCYGMTYGEIVKRLFLWNTTHSGGASTAAKCRELGVDYSDEFWIGGEEEEDDEKDV